MKISSFTNPKLTGSYTVETACLSGLFLLVVFLTGWHPYDAEFVRLYLSFI